MHGAIRVYTCASDTDGNNQNKAVQKILMVVVFMGQNLKFSSFSIFHVFCTVVLLSE